MKWSDRSPAMRVLAIGAGGLLSVDLVLLILATVHVIPIDPLVYVGFPILALVGAGVIVSAILDQRWQLDQAVRRARDEHDGGPT